MTKLPRGLSGRRVDKALGRCGFKFHPQTGSHWILVRSHPAKTVPVPDYEETGPGLLKATLKQSGLTREQFLAAL